MEWPEEANKRASSTFPVLWLVCNIGFISFVEVLRVPIVLFSHHEAGSPSRSINKRTREVNGSDHQTNST